MAAEDFVDETEEDEDDMIKDENIMEDNISNKSNLKPITEDYLESDGVELEVPVQCGYLCCLQ